MDTLPLASIIIPSYNRSRLLREAIESALAQTYPNVEVIVVDDGSVDDTPQVMAEYNGRVHYIRQANQGVAAARNAGIRASRGEYLSFLDDDDLFLPTKIQRQMRLLDTKPGLGLVHCRYYRADWEGNYLDIPGLLPEGEILALLVRWNFVWVGGPLIRRECFDRVGVFDENGPSVTADWDLWLRIAMAGYEFGCIQEPVGVYRIHPHSMMSSIVNVEHGVIAVLEKAFADPTLPAHVVASRYQSLAIARLWLGCLYYNAKQWDNGQRNVTKAIELYPALLMQHKQITQLLCNIALGHRISDPPQFVADMLDHLPANGHSLRRYRAYIYNRLYIQLSLQSYGAGDVARAQRQLNRALDFKDGMPSPAATFSELLAYAALHLPLHDPIRYIDHVFKHLPARAKSFHSTRTWTLNKAHLKLAREASLSGARQQGIRHTILGLLYRPYSIRTWKRSITYMRWLANK